MDLIVRNARLAGRPAEGLLDIAVADGKIAGVGHGFAAAAESYEAGGRLAGLALDLRNDAGGLLDAAVEVTSDFLDSGTVVTTRGRESGENRVYDAPPNGDLVRGTPVVVLINGASASASEIVAGALQDHDRAIIIGETSWGKGLVQSVYTLQYGAGLALTTSKYYTPSGRNIQRDYSSFYDYYVADDSEDGGSEVPLKDRKKYTTATGRIVYGGGRPKGFGKGYYVEPTIFYAVDNNARISREEIFGPVATVIPFDDEAGAIRIANDTPYGLAAAVWTRDIYKAFRVVKAVRAGIIWVNHMQPTYVEAPWGGYKMSGMGRELGPWGADEYLQIKQVHINLSEQPIGWY